MKFTPLEFAILEMLLDNLDQKLISADCNDVFLKEEFPDEMWLQLNAEFSVINNDLVTADPLPDYCYLTVLRKKIADAMKPE